MGAEPAAQDYKSNTLPDRSLRYLCLKQSLDPSAMHDWFCQIWLIESIWQKKKELKESFQEWFWVTE